MTTVNRLIELLETIKMQGGGEYRCIMLSHYHERDLISHISDDGKKHVVYLSFEAEHCPGEQHD